MVDVESGGGVTRIFLNRPEKVNALNSVFLGELLAALRDAAAPDARAVVLAGRGKAFCGGADVKELSILDASSAPGFVEKIHAVCAAIRALPLDEATLRTYEAHIGVADAVCYVGGALGVILTCTVIGPALLRVDLVEESLALERRYGIVRTRTGIASAWQPFETRGYRVAEGAPIVGRTVAEAERVVDGMRLFIHRIRREGELVDPTPGFRKRFET